MSQHLNCITADLWLGAVSVTSINIFLVPFLTILLLSIFLFRCVSLCAKTVDVCVMFSKMAHGLQETHLFLLIWFMKFYVCDYEQLLQWHCELFISFNCALFFLVRWITGTTQHHAICLLYLYNHQHLLLISTCYSICSWMILKVRRKSFCAPSISCCFPLLFDRFSASIALHMSKISMVSSQNCT